LPLTSRIRRTAAGSVIDGSSITDMKRLSSTKSSTGLVAALLRSMDFGVNTTIGRCTPSRAWRRSRWK
jgi:hypothetical protein